MYEGETEGRLGKGWGMGNGEEIGEGVKGRVGRKWECRGNAGAGGL